MMCVHCKKAILYEEEDYTKVVTKDRKEFYHNPCFAELFQRKGGDSICQCQANDTATHVSSEPSA